MLSARASRWKRVLTRTAVVTGLLAMTACASNAPQDTLKPEGSSAHTIQNLIIPVFMVAAVIFVLVEGLIVFFVIRYRHRPENAEPVQIHGSTRLEVTWTAIPALILLMVAIPTVFTIAKLSRKPANAVQVTVIAHQWWWEYRYPQLGVVTANELHMPAGKSVELELQGADVIHSFWVPRLGGKTDVVPGRHNHMSLKADHPGTYLGQCVEFCGLSHANMRLRAMVQTPGDFAAWVAAQRTDAPTPEDSTLAAEGMALFTQRGCAGCHTIGGVSKGMVGPNLTHLQSRTTFAGAIFNMSAENLKTWIHDPPTAKPGSKMPNLHIPPDDINKLVAYLETLH